MRTIVHILLLVFLNINLLGQCTEPDASIWKDTWVSCEKTDNPIAAYGKTHWILYNLGIPRYLSRTWIWNTNDPERLDQGFNKVQIDYSLDGKTWTNWGEMKFPKAEGEAVYGGFPGPNLQGIQAQYVLITVKDNYGHPSCAGLAEVKFNLLSNGPDTTVVLPGNKCGIIDTIELAEQWSTAAFFYWEVEAEYVVFEYKIEGTAKWIELETDSYELFLEDLEPATTYEYRLTAWCQEEKTTSEIFTFTTAACVAINEVPDVTIEEEGVFVQWPLIREVPYYRVAYKPVDDEVFEVVEAQGNNIFLFDLDLEREYELYVGINCDEEPIWSPPAYFLFTKNRITSINDEEIDQGTLLKLYPNPTSSELTFIYESRGRDILNYCIVNLKGQTVFRNLQRIEHGQNRISINLDWLDAGTYFLQTSAMKNSIRRVEQFVKLKR